MPLKQRKQFNENNVIKNPNWKEADEWVYVKRVGLNVVLPKTDPSSGWRRIQTWNHRITISSA